jgi:hypothetical protein
VLLNPYNLWPRVLRLTQAGRLWMTPTAWDDEPTSGAIIRPGAVAPTEKDYLGVRHLHFDVGAEASVSMQLKHRWKAGTTVYPHIHIGLAVAAGTPARIQFRFTGYKSAVGYIGTAWGPTDVEIIVSGFAQYYECIITAGALDMSVYPQESAIVGMKVKRIAATANEYNGGTDDVALLSADSHFENEKLGTAQETPPFTP